MKFMVVFSSSNGSCLVSDKEMVQLDFFGVVWVIKFLRCSDSCRDECNRKKLSNVIVLFQTWYFVVFSLYVCAVCVYLVVLY